MLQGEVAERECARRLTMRAKTNMNSRRRRLRYITWLKLLRMVVMMRLSSAQLRASLNTRSSRAVLSTDSELEPDTTGHSQVREASSTQKSVCR
jgi:hypothetical protein